MSTVDMLGVLCYRSWVCCKLCYCDLLSGYSYALCVRSLDYSFSRLLWHIFPSTVYFFKTAHTQPLTEAEMTKTLYDVCRMTPPSQNLSHTHQNQTFLSKPTICAQLKMYVFSFIYQWITKFKLQLSISTSAAITSPVVQHPH